ncbi:MAG TPA: VOC family protein [Rhabdochlamydiaceae bacterium]|jgi:predicted enzyme related to lactoylglutathione lyase
MIKGIKHVSIPVKDQDKALDFFHNKLGFAIICDVPFEGGQRWIELKIPNTDTQVALFTPQGHEDRIGTFSNIVFTCGDIEKTYEELKGRGVEFMHPPKKEPWGSFTLFKDVDNNLFCLSSSDS